MSPEQEQRRCRYKVEFTQTVVVAAENQEEAINNAITEIKKGGNVNIGDFYAYVDGEEID